MNRIHIFVRLPKSGRQIFLLLTSLIVSLSFLAPRIPAPARFLDGVLPLKVACMDGPVFATEFIIEAHQITPLGMPFASDFTTF